MEAILSKTEAPQFPSVRALCELWGTITAAAAAFGFEYGRVSAWVGRGIIPEAHWPAVIAAAAEINVVIGPVDLHAINQAGRGLPDSGAAEPASVELGAAGGLVSAGNHCAASPRGYGE